MNINHSIGRVAVLILNNIDTININNLLKLININNKIKTIKIKKHSGYHGGYKEKLLYNNKIKLKNNILNILIKVISGMLPKNKLKKNKIKKIRKKINEQI